MKLIAVILSVLLPWGVAEAHSVKVLRCAFLHANDTGTPYRGDQIHNLSVHQNSSGYYIKETKFGRGTRTYDLHEVSSSQRNGSVNSAYVTRGPYTATFASVDGVLKSGMLTLRGRYNSFCKGTNNSYSEEEPVPTTDSL